MNTSPNDRPTDITLKTERRVDTTARVQRQMIIGEYLPGVNPERVDKIFYGEIIQPRVRAQFQEEIASYVDFLHPEADEYAVTYLMCNSRISSEFYGGLHDPDAALISGEFSDSLDRVMTIYEQRGMSWEGRARQWAAVQTNEDINIWELALQDFDSVTIKEVLKRPERPEDITQRILLLQRDLLLTFLRGLD